MPKLGINKALIKTSQPNKLTSKLMRENPSQILPKSPKQNNNSFQFTVRQTMTPKSFISIQSVQNMFQNQSYPHLIRTSLKQQDPNTQVTTPIFRGTKSKMWNN